MGYLYATAADAANGAIRYDALCKERDKISLSDRTKFCYVKEKPSDDDRDKRDRKDSPLQYEKRGDTQTKKPSLATTSVRDLANQIYTQQQKRERDMIREENER